MTHTRLTFLGTGTSQGVPIIGCGCKVCTSPDPADKRFRASALVECGGLTILIDAGPDFRSQMLNAKVSHLDAILLTHNHKDHTGGLDDVRSLNYVDKKAMEIWCEGPVIETLKTEYGYAFADKKYPGSPEWHIHLIGNRAFRVFSTRNSGSLEWVHDKGYFCKLPSGELVPSVTAVETAPAVEADSPLTGSLDDGTPWVKIIPIRGWHGQMPVLGFRIGDIAYITDISRIDDEELLKLKGLKHLTLNTVGYKPHHSHLSLEEALRLAGRIGARHTWLTHLSHTFPVHSEFEVQLKTMCRDLGIGADVRPARDSLVIED